MKQNNNFITGTNYGIKAAGILLTLIGINTIDTISGTFNLVSGAWLLIVLWLYNQEMKRLNNNFNGECVCE